MSLSGFPSLSAFAFASIALVSSCNNGSNAVPADGRAEVFLSSSTGADLASFSGTIEDVRLLTDGGSSTGNLVSTPLEVELVGLGNRNALIASSLTRRGTYQTAQITFSEGSLRALAKNGTEIPVLALGHVLTLPLDQNARIDRRGFATVLVDVDLRGSIDDTLSPLTIAFDPEGTATSPGGPTSFPIDDFKGLVLSSDTASSTIVVQSFRDEDLSVPVRRLEVQVDPTALLQDENDVSFVDEPAFFASLVDDASLLEFHGTQDEAGLVLAQRIKVDDHAGGLDSDERVKIEGYVVGLDTMGTMQLLIQEFEQGAASAAIALSSLGDPSIVDVGFTTMLPVFQNLTSPVSTTSLAIGQRVKVKFDTFTGTPFQATSVEIVEEPTHVVEIDVVSGFTIDVTFDADDYSIQGGLVADETTTVQVDLNTALLVLDVEGRPGLSGIELLPGQRAKITGTLSGPASAPVLDATELRVLPGRFAGSVATTNPAGGSFESHVDALAQDFGPSVPVCNVTIRPECVFRGAANDEVEFFNLYSGLAADESLQLRVQGIASGPQNEVAAFVIEVVSH